MIKALVAVALLGFFPGLATALPYDYYSPTNIWKRECLRRQLGSKYTTLDQAEVSYYSFMCSAYDPPEKIRTPFSTEMDQWY